MNYEVARKTSLTPEEKARALFGLAADDHVSAVFTNVTKTAVIAVTGLLFYVPVAEKLAVMPEIASLLCNGSSVLLTWNGSSFTVTCLTEGQKQEAAIDPACSEKITALLSSTATWGGRINEDGELVCDLVSPSPGPNYYTNMLLGNRLSHGAVLQCTPKSVVDRFGCGSFRSHADTQVLATRWDYLPEENGFPANRQFYLVENGKVIFYSADATRDNIVDATCVHSQNHTVITYTLTSGLKIRRTIFLLPQKDNMPIACEAQLVELENTGKADRDLKLVYTGMLSNASTVCLREDIIYMTVIEESGTVSDENGNLTAVAYHYNPEYEQSDLRFHTTLAHVDGRTVYPTEYCFNYAAFVGNGTLKNPEGAARLNNRHTRKGPAFFAVSTPITVKAGSRVQVDNLTCLTSEKLDPAYKGIETMKRDVAAVNAFLKDENSLPSTLAEIRAFTKKYTSFIQISDRDKAFERYFNTNLPFQVYYQNFVSRSFDQTQKGYREIGFREIQDLYASMCYWIGMGRADIVKGFLSEWAQNIYKFGYANHNFFWVGKEAGVSSDDQLWLLQALDRYITLTGDYDFLKTEVAMADGGTRPLLDTVKAIITYSAKISVGKHGLPLNDLSDWNDCLRVDPDCITGPQKEKLYEEQLANGGSFGDPLPSEGAESVMNGFLLKAAVDIAAGIFAHFKMSKDEQAMRALSQELYNNLQTHTWKGDFFCRLLFNRSDRPELTYLGARGDGLSNNPKKDGAYFINTFSWSILSDVATDEQIEIMLNTLDKNLRTPFGFQLTSEVAYPKITAKVSASNFFYGDRENGGIFKHANMMLAASMVKAANRVKSKPLAARLAETAYWLVDKILPYASMKSPFTVCGNPRFCTQYNNADTGENIGPTLSGTSSWLLITLTMLLGINYTGGKISFCPLLKPEETEKHYTVSINRAHYEVTVTKPVGFVRALDASYSFTVDGKEEQELVFPIFDDDRTHKLVLSF